MESFGELWNYEKFLLLKKLTDKQKIIYLNLKTHFLLIKLQNKKMNKRIKKIVCLSLK